jgi:hypothetical protein
VVTLLKKTQFIVSVESYAYIHGVPGEVRPAGCPNFWPFDLPTDFNKYYPDFQKKNKIK